MTIERFKASNGVRDGRFFPIPLLRPVDPGWKPAAFPEDFTEGERSWPEATA